jgi:hypothetical protein
MLSLVVRTRGFKGYSCCSCGPEMSCVRLPHMSVTVYTKSDPSSLILGCPSSHPTSASCVPNVSLSVLLPVSARHSFALSIPRVLRSTSKRCLWFLPLPPPFACYMFNCNGFLRKKKRYFWFFPSEFQTFFITPMRAIRCTHFILLQFIIIMLVE